MDLVTLTETIIKKIVSDPDSVSVKEFETEEENTIQIEVLISNDDMGKVIGRDGKIAKAIRTVVKKMVDFVFFIFSLFTFHVLRMFCRIRTFFFYWLIL